MKKYLSITPYDPQPKEKEVVHKLFVMPDKLEERCRLCSTGPMLILTDEQSDGFYGISIEVDKSLHKLCYDLEETEHAHNLETCLVTVFNEHLAAFLVSDEAVFKTDITKKVLEQVTHEYLLHIQQFLKEQKRKKNRSSKKTAQNKNA